MYSKSGDIYRPATNGSVIPKLPNSTFLICFNPEVGYFLKETEAMKLPTKIYGHNTRNSDKIMKMFLEEQGRTSGALLSGVKGTGKTLTAIEVCLNGQELGMPVLLLQDPHCGTAFNDFMATIKESCIVFVDEFEKVYKKEEDVHSLLPLLDGAVKTHKLFLLTSNKSMKEVGEKMEYLANRPSRVFYTFEYGTMDDSVITEYLQDHLKYDTYFSDILALKRSFTAFTIDILKAIVVEVNRYGSDGKDISEILKDLNVKTDRGLKSYQYTPKLKFFGREFGQEFIPVEDTYTFSGTLLEIILGQCDDFIRGDSRYFSFKLPYSLLSGTEWSELRNSCRNVRDLEVVHPNGAIRVMGDFEGGWQSRDPETGDWVKFTPESEKQLLVKVKFNMSEGDILKGAVKVSQDKVSRAITLSFHGDQIALEMRPQITLPKPEKFYVI